MAKKNYFAMMIFVLTVHSVSLILIYTVKSITLRSYSNAFWFCSTIETSLFQLLRY
jgi:hypothetical protein